MNKGKYTIQAGDIIVPTESLFGLTEGAEYKIISQTMNDYLIRDDFEDIEWFPKNVFDSKKVARRKKLRYLLSGKK